MPIKVKSEMLDLPATLPDAGHAKQILSVFESKNGHHEIHVEIAEVFDDIEHIGAWLAHVVRVIAHLYPEDTEHGEADAFAIICRSFNECADDLKQQP